jgi:hypothetical protein
MDGPSRRRDGENIRGVVDLIGSSAAAAGVVRSVHNRQHTATVQTGEVVEPPAIPANQMHSDLRGETNIVCLQRGIHFTDEPRVYAGGSDE